MIETLSGPRAGLFGLPRLSWLPFLRAIAGRMFPPDINGSMQVVWPSGARLRIGKAGSGPEPILTIRRPTQMISKVARRGSLGFAEAYISGDVDCDDLTGLFLFYLSNYSQLEAAGDKLGLDVAQNDRAAHVSRANSRKMSRQNIADHYDLGNEFYRLWLDPGMMYSSALYGADASSLEDAQSAKLDLILEAMNPAPGASILEIGCGWGALACRAAREHGAKVTGITLSEEQLAWSRRTAQEAGLSEACSFHLQDYRDTEGQFDHIMSVEMIEAVGQEYWPAYFRTLADRLTAGGNAVVQAITIDEKNFPSYSQTVDFIQRYIFPGGLLPTKTIIREEGEKVGLTLESQTCFGLSYARTLKDWRHRFEEAWDQIAPLGFDDRFRRTWRYYLTYCEAGFRDGTVDVGVYSLRKPS